MSASVRQAVRESLLLPVLFLTVAGAGGFRVTDTGQMRFLPPSLASLVLAGLLMSALVQSGLLRPAALVLDRRFLPGLSGAVLLATIFAATAQLLGGLLPEHGLFALLFGVFFAVLLTSTMAAAPDGPRLLRSLSVTFAWALLMKYVLLSALGPSEDASWLAQAARALISGVTLGSVSVESWSPVVGYVMFTAAALYLIGLWLLGPSEAESSRALGAATGGEAFETMR